MSVQLREKRRSLYLPKNLKDVGKEIIRPKSWFLSNSRNNDADIDPYTSLRKIFYEQPKRDSLEKDIIKKSLANIDEEAVKHSMKNLEYIHLNANPSLLRRKCSDDSSISSHNNNNTINSISPKSIISNYLSKNADTTSLKEDSSTYADFYVPTQATRNQRVMGFLRRSKRWSFDPKLSKEIDIFSLDSRSFNQSIQELRFGKEMPDKKIGLNENGGESTESLTCVYIPWTKRNSLLESKRGKEPKRYADTPFKRNARAHSSLRHFTKDEYKQSNSTSLQRSRTLQKNQRRPSYNKHLSDSTAPSSGFTRRLSAMSLMSKNFQQQDASSSKQKRKNSDSFYFFSHYEDRLRDCCECETSSKMQRLSKANKLYPKLHRSFSQQGSNETYRHIFYVRSRLSKSARKEDFQCVGWLGCDEHLCPKDHWV